MGKKFQRKNFKKNTILSLAIVVIFLMVSSPFSNLVAEQIHKDAMLQDEGEYSFLENYFDENLVNESSLQGYESYYVGGPSSFDFELVAGESYFILAEDPSLNILNGIMIPQVSIPLNIGWNMIGWYRFQDIMASSLGENITGCEIVSWFDSTIQGYNSYYVGGPSSFDFEITSGMGIFVLTDEESIWQGEG